MKTLALNTVGNAKTVVSENNIAKTMKSGALSVFATPAMCALMEEAACVAAQDALEDGEGTVGISLNISHTRASALGDTIVATATLVAVEGRKLTFEVEAKDSKGTIGKGNHERFVINNEKFMSKL